MRILILGTSNSILRNGYVDGLRESLPNVTFVNASIGASPGLQFGLALQKNLDQYSHIIYDSTPNDEQYSYETFGYSCSDEHDTITEQILSSLSAQSNLIIVSFCLSKFLYQPSRIYKHRLEMATRVHAHFVDIAEILTACGNANPDISLYEDHPAHPSLTLSYEIGSVIGKKIAEGAFEDRRGRSKNYSDNFRCFRPNDEHGHFSKIFFKNSFTEETFLTLNAYCDLDLPSGRCIGFYVNAYGTRCGISLSYRGKISAVSNLNYELKSGFQKLFVPLPKIIEIDRISIGNFHESPHFIPRMTFASDLNQSIDQATFQVSEFLFWDDSQLHSGPVSHGEATSESECKFVSNKISAELSGQKIRSRTTPQNS